MKFCMIFLTVRCFSDITMHERTFHMQGADTMNRWSKKISCVLTAGVFAVSFALPWSATPAVAEASAATKIAKGAAGGLAGLWLLSKIVDYRNAHYYEYAKPVGAIEKQYTPMGPHEVADWKASADGKDWKAYEVFYPKDVTSMDGKLPVVLMANGTGTPVSKYREVLRHLASWGFIVAGNEEDNSRSGEGVIATLHYVEACGETEDSPLFGHVDADAIGVAGHSQGGVGALHAAMNFPESSSIRSVFTASTTSRFWGDGGPLGKEWDYDVSGLQPPIFMTAGTGDWDAGKTNDPHAKEGQGIAPLWSLKQTYATLPAATPKVIARRKGKDHGDMLRAADAYMTAWFAYTLKHDEAAGKAFFGKDSELAKNKNYQDVQASNGETQMTGDEKGL